MRCGVDGRSGGRGGLLGEGRGVPGGPGDRSSLSLSLPPYPPVRGGPHPLEKLSFGVGGMAGVDCVWVGWWVGFLGGWVRIRRLLCCFPLTCCGRFPHPTSSSPTFSSTNPPTPRRHEPRVEKEVPPPWSPRAPSPSPAMPKKGKGTKGKKGGSKKKGGTKKAAKPKVEAPVDPAQLMKDAALAAKVHDST